MPDTARERTKNEPINFDSFFDNWKSGLLKEVPDSLSEYRGPLEKFFDGQKETCRLEKKKLDGELAKADYAGQWKAFLKENPGPHNSPAWAKQLKDLKKSSHGEAPAGPSEPSEHKIKSLKIFDEVFIAPLKNGQDLNNSQRAKDTLLNAFLNWYAFFYVGELIKPDTEGTQKKYTIGPELEEPKLHRQSRAYLKTAGALVARDTTRPQLFDLDPEDRFDGATNPIRESISKLAGITGTLLIQKWQKEKNNDGIYRIENLSELARELDTNPQYLKICLLCLGGYQYPVKHLVEKNGKRYVGFSMEKMFSIAFFHKLEQNETEADYGREFRIGTRFLSFIMDKDLDFIDVRPSEFFIKGLDENQNLKRVGNKKKPLTLGNILVDDTFVAFSLNLSDTAYKLFCFMGSNKPHYTIRFSKLIEPQNLNLGRQVSNQGKPRILKQLFTALDELKSKGHLEAWSYEETTDKFEWVYTKKIFKHKDFLPAPEVRK